MADISISYLYTLKDKFSGKIKDINRNLSKNKKLIKSMNADLNKFSGSFAKVALAGTAAFTGITVAAARFESGINSVKTLLDKPVIKKFSGEIDAAAKSAIGLGFSMADTNKSLFNAVSAIGDVPKSLEVFNRAQILAKGGGADLAVSISGLTAVMNAYRLSTDQAGIVAEAFFTSQRFGTTDVAKLAANVGKVAPIAKDAGIGFKVLLASMAELTKGGISTEEAATGLRSAIAALKKPVESQRALFKKLKIPFGATALAAADFTDVLGNLAIAARDNKDELVKIIPNLQALNTLAALGIPQIRELKNIVNVINENYKTGRGLMEAYALVMDETRQRALKTKGAFTKLAITFGTQLLPITNKVLDATTKILDKFTALSPQTQKLILQVLGAVTAFSGLAVGIVVVQKVMPAIIAAFGLLDGVVALLAGPIGLVVLAIGALIIFGPQLAKKYKPIRIIFEKIAAALKFISTTKIFRDIKDLFVGPSFEEKRSKKFSDIKDSDIIHDLISKPIAPDLISQTAQGQRGFFEANININAPKGTVKSVESKEKKTPFINLGLNLQDLIL